LSEKKDASEQLDEDNESVENDTPTNEVLDNEEPLDDNADKNQDTSSIEEINKQLETKVVELKDQLMRTLAESENLRKRTIKEVDQAKKYSHISFVRDLVSSVDNLQRALDSIPEDKANLSEPIKNLIIGLEIVEKEIISTFEKHNLKQIVPFDEKFDYNFHQAMFEVPTNDKEPGVVVEVSQKGYLLHDRLVRPAMVGISKKPEEIKVDEEKKDDS
jgi:molecular chaperone GrpE